MVLWLRISFLRWKILDAGFVSPFPRGHEGISVLTVMQTPQAPSHSRILASVSWGQIHDVGIQRNGSQLNLFSDPPANNAMLSLSATKMSLQRNPFKISKYSLPKTVLPRNKGSHHTFYANSFRESFSLCLCLPLSPSHTHLPTHTHIHTRTQHKHQSHKLIHRKWRCPRSNMKHNFKTFC